uniref:Uncharacterized protein n=1 Tax=Gossypium raimondii TaxID=29730 RepID=A0A0D2U3Z6_GOSRA|nr:hypothetical protein B456_013G194200 [Gossypium raimondii]
MLTSPQGQKQKPPKSVRKVSPSESHKDLWLAVREGSLPDVDSALTLLKKTAGTVNCRYRFGLTPLHIVTWRNHLPIIQRLLAAGADPDAKDGESGWSSLHRAPHFGHLAVASVLLQSGASITLEDSNCRTPIDLLSGPVLKIFESGLDSVAPKVFCWGSGVNYQLGTGNAHIQKLPCKLDSVAVTAHGKVYTWGFGRGGRLEHPDFDIHSKYNTVVATEVGEVFTWGSNREGQLGYTSVDTQPTPRRVSSLKSRIVAVAAANKHTAVVSESGEVFTWGCNREGQLGYGTSNSASNYTPRIVEYLKGKVFKADGEVYTWGHRLVSPRRVVITRNLKKSGSTPMKFHRKERLHAVAIAAGMVHSMAITEDGALFYWVSSDPDLRCQQDCKKSMDKPPVATQLHGVKRATSVSVGETHLLSIVSLYHSIHPPYMPLSDQVPKLKVNDEGQELDEEVLFNDPDSSGMRSSMHKIAAECLVEPQNAIQLLEIADSLGADDLRKYCEDIVIRNLDYILTVSSQAFASASPDVLASLEKSLDSRSTESWSYRRLPTPTATFPVIINSDEEDSESEVLRIPLDSFLQPKDYLNQGISEQVQALQKKLQQIEVLEMKQLGGYILDDQQIAKVQRKPDLEDSLAELGLQVEKSQSKGSCSISADAKGNKKAEVSRKQRRKSKQRVAQVERVSDFSTMHFFLLLSKCCESAAHEILREIGTHLSPRGKKRKCYSYVAHSRSLFKFSREKELLQFCCMSTFFVQRKDSSVHAEDKSTSQTTTKKKNRKGGLSMFLSGALDDASKHILLPPPTPRSEGPAWGSAKVLKGKASLREIQDEQSKLRVNWLTGSKNQVEDLPEVRNGEGKILLSSFLPSKPIFVGPVQASQVSDVERTTPPWAASGGTHLFRPSLRDIQMQQGKQLQSFSQSKNQSGCPTATGQDSPLDSPAMSRRFKPEVEATSSIR